MNSAMGKELSMSGTSGEKQKITRGAVVVKEDQVRRQLTDR